MLIEIPARRWLVVGHEGLGGHGHHPRLRRAIASMILVLGRAEVVALCLPVVLAPARPCFTSVLGWTEILNPDERKSPARENDPQVEIFQSRKDFLSRDLAFRK